MISKESPVIFLILALMTSLCYAILLFIRYLNGKGKRIPHIIAASSIVLLMGTVGVILGLITNSGSLLTTIYALGLAFMGAIVYTSIELIDMIKKQ